MHALSGSRKTDSSGRRSNSAPAAPPGTPGPAWGPTLVRHGCVVVGVCLVSACGTVEAEAGVPAAPREEPTPAHRAYATAEAALEAALEGRPRAIGVGELHSVDGGPAATPAIERFHRELLPALRGRATDLVVETWVVPAGCAEPARRATRRVEVEIARPAAVVDHVGVLLERAAALGIRPHVLELACADYAAVRSDDGEILYERLLERLTALLRDEAVRGLADEGAVVALYGGALHNDRYPSIGALSYGPAVEVASGHRYVEIDLVVPEIARSIEALRAEPWFPLLARAGPDRWLLVERAASSYVLVLPTSAAP